MKRRIIVFLTVFIIALPMFCIFAGADGKPRAEILDYANVISSANETVILEKAEEVANKTGFNIIIVAADDIGQPKTDSHVVEYADDKYEDLCGINTDGVLFLINCDTKYDYISTSGVCINYLSDERIDHIFDDIWDDLKNEDFAQAAYTFLFRLEYYYDQGKANHQVEFMGQEVDFSFGSFVANLFPAGFVGLLIGTAVYAGYAKQYKMEKPGTRNYILENSLVFDINTDTYIGTNVNRIYTPRSRSSSSHHSSGGHHHSSTHHSHSGGRHGGGGRHR